MSRAAGWALTIVMALASYPGGPTGASADTQTGAPALTRGSAVCASEPEGHWTSITQVDAPAVRVAHAVWTGREVLYLGGRGGGYDVAGRYDPVTDTWRPLSLEAAPVTGRAVWTGAELLVWPGGTEQRRSGESDAVTAGPGGQAGGRYDPVTDVWRPMAVAGQPEVVYQPYLASWSSRNSLVLAWSGRELLVWGEIGRTHLEPTFGGARYDPGADRWQPIAASPYPIGRLGLVGTWTGRELLVWGGGSSWLRQIGAGARYDPVTDTWRPMSQDGAPDGGSQYGAWTGTHLLVWGGNTGLIGDTFRAGGAYDPVTDTWTPFSLEGAPVWRTEMSAVWTGRELILWGGDRSTRSLASLMGNNDGFAYDPAADTWRMLPAVDLTPRDSAAAVWTGDEMIILGGTRGSALRYLPFMTDLGARYVPPC